MEIHDDSCSSVLVVVTFCFTGGLPTGLASLQGTRDGIYERTEFGRRTGLETSDGSWFHLAAAVKEIERLP